MYLYKNKKSYLKNKTLGSLKLEENWHYNHVNRVHTSPTLPQKSLRKSTFKLFKFFSFQQYRFCGVGSFFVCENQMLFESFYVFLEWFCVFSNIW